MFLKNPVLMVKRVIARAKIVMWKVLHGWEYKELGTRSIIVKPLQVTPQYIRLKDRVYIHFHGRIQGVDCYEGVRYSPEIIFDEGASAQQNLHMTCADRIYIGKNTALAANVTVTDINHSYRDINTPIEQQKIEVHPVEIGKDCKIYNNAVILPGTIIGDHCVVGANSVVSGKYDSFSIIVGAPAKVVKKYDFNTATWVSQTGNKCTDW